MGPSKERRVGKKGDTKTNYLGSIATGSGSQVTPGNKSSAEWITEKGEIRE